MNKSESKYFHTAEKMDKAFLELLEKKDFAYITVKEICEKAGVHRSTFYLHYETIEDLLEECRSYMNEQFLQYMQHDTQNFIQELHTCSLEELYLITPEYLKPYLQFIQEYRRLFQTTTANADVLRLDDTYAKMFHHVFTPILERYQVPEAERTYLLTFYISGVMAVVNQWLKADCSDSVEQIIALIQKCIPKAEREV